MCSVEGHRAADCPNSDTCRRCGSTGHFARACPVARPSFAEVARGATGPSSSGNSGQASLPVRSGALCDNDDDSISLGEDSSSQVASASGGTPQVTVDSAITKMASACPFGTDSVGDSSEPAARSRAASIPCLSQPSVSSVPVVSVVCE